MADKKSELEGILEELEKNLQGTAKENMEYIESRFSSMELSSYCFISLLPVAVLIRE